MSGGGFQDYAALWQEQIGEEELAELRVRAKAIARIANRRRLLDFVLAALAVGISCVILFSSARSLVVKLCFLGLLAGMISVVWWRHRIAMAARAIAVDHPRHFFESAIRSVRSELRLSSFTLWMGLPALILSTVMVKAAEGADVVDWLPRDIGFGGIALLALFLLGYVYFLRDHGKIRAQLRSLEAMRREWEDQSAR